MEGVQQSRQLEQGLDAAQGQGRVREQGAAELAFSQVGKVQLAFLEEGQGCSKHSGAPSCSLPRSLHKHHVSL